MLPPHPDFAWFDASGLASVATSSDGSGAVSTWKDKSGQGRDALVGKDAAPVWYANGTSTSRPAIRFDGSTVRLQTQLLPTAQNFTLFKVFEMDKPQTWGSVVNQGHDTYFSLHKSDCCGGNG
jgi:hypothetical protein